MTFLVSRITAFCGAIVFSLSLSSAVMAQSSNVERLQQQSRELAEIQDWFRVSAANTTGLIASFLESGAENGSGDLDAIFDEYESIAKDALSQIALESESRDALDGMRAELEVLIIRQRQEPASARRDARLQRYAELQETYNEQTERIAQMDQNLTDRLVDLARERRELSFDRDLQDVETIVGALQEALSNLEAMDQQLGAIVATTYEDPEIAGQ